MAECLQHKGVDLSSSPSYQRKAGMVAQACDARTGTGQRALRQADPRAP